MQEKCAKKVGPVYIAVARKCFPSLHPEITAGARDEILARGDLHEIEKLVPIVRLMGVTTKTFTREMANHGVSSTIDLFWCLLFSQEPEMEMHEYVDRVNSRRFLDMQKMSFCYKTMLEVHNEWMQVYQKLFFDIKRSDERCRFMPFELIGADMALKYLVYVEDLFRLLGWRIDEREFRRYYGRRQEEFLKNTGLNQSRFLGDTLVDYLMQIRQPIPASISSVLHSDRMLARKVATS